MSEVPLYSGRGKEPGLRLPRAASASRRESCVRSTAVGLFYRLGGDNLSELSANYQPLADKTDTDKADNTILDSGRGDEPGLRLPSAASASRRSSCDMYSPCNRVWG